MARVARLGQMSMRSIEVHLLGHLGKDDLSGQRLIGVDRQIQVGGPLSESQLGDLLTAAQNCVVGNVLKGVTEFEAVVEPQEPDPKRHDYLPAPGSERRLETEVRARGLDDLFLVPIRVGGHTLFSDETRTKREHIGCGAVAMLVGAFTADAVATVRRAAADKGMLVKGIEVESHYETLRSLGEGPRFPSGSAERGGTFWGRLPRVQPTIRLWGDLGHDELEGLRNAALTGPVAWSLANPVKIEDRLEHIPRP